MYWISHRGNLNGPSDQENKPEYIEAALNQGFDVEIDVWHVDGSYWLGHDKPQYITSLEFLKQPRLWIHCKNISAYGMLKKESNYIHCFCINKDPFTITTRGHLWLGPGTLRWYDNTICVMPEDLDWIQNGPLEVSFFAGVCSDNIYHYKEHATNTRR